MPTISAARSRPVQPAPAFEQAASGQTGRSAIRGSRSRSSPSVASSSSSQSRVVRSSRPLVDAIQRLVSASAAEIVGEGDEPGRAAEGLGLRLGEPGELRRPERGVEERAGARVHRLGVEPAREPLGRGGAARVAPAEDRRERVPVRVDRDEAVREARGRVRLLVPEHAADGRCDLGGIGRLRTLPAAARRPALRARRSAGPAPTRMPMSSASTLIPPARRCPRPATFARGRRSGRSARAGPRRAAARSSPGGRAADRARRVPPRFAPRAARA